MLLASASLGRSVLWGAELGLRDVEASFHAAQSAVSHACSYLSPSATKPQVLGHGSL